jgi:hypothetical protein
LDIIQDSRHYLSVMDLTNQGHDFTISLKFTNFGVMTFGAGAVVLGRR